MDITSNKIGILTEKDKESRIIKCNHVLLEQLGVKTDDKILGYTDYDFPWQEYADIYRRHELEILEGNDHAIIFPFKNAYGERTLYLHNKTGMRDEKGHVTGIVGHAREILNPTVHKLFSHLADIEPADSNKFYLHKDFGQHNLTKREQEVMFFLAKGKTTKAIASILDMSPRTVNSHIDNMKTKFNCHNKSELLDKAYSLGLAQSIPLTQTFEKLLEGLR